MSGAYDERYGDIWFEEEDPTSEFYDPKCCRDMYIDLVNGVFDIDLNADDCDYWGEDEDDYYYDEGEYDDF